MTPQEFQSTAIAILRSAVGWQTAIARRLDVEPRTVRRWVKDGPPSWAIEKMQAMIGAGEIAPWPRDEWMIGDARGGDGNRREYIMHMQPPRFIARVVACDGVGEPLAEEHPVDDMTGIVYSANEATTLCEIDWIDEVRPGEHVKWLEAAADALDAIDE